MVNLVHGLWLEAGRSGFRLRSCRVGAVLELEFDGVPGVSPSYSLLYHIVMIGVGEQVCWFT
jgi:hypothetical protein